MRLADEVRPLGLAPKPPSLPPCLGCRVFVVLLLAVVVFLIIALRRLQAKRKPQQVTSEPLHSDFTQAHPLACSTYHPPAPCPAPSAHPLAAPSSLSALDANIFVSFLCFQTSTYGLWPGPAACGLLTGPLVTTSTQRINHPPNDPGGG